jgi:hypothetical protein
MVLRENLRVQSLRDRFDCLEFQQIRKELKAKQAKQREQSNASSYRQSGNSVYRTTQNTPHVYSQTHVTKFVDLQLYEPSPTAAARLHHQPYPIHANSSRSRHEITTERAWGETSQGWHTSSPSIPPSTRWSPDNYHDLHSRHPSFAKDLLSQTNVREATLSPRNIELAWNEDRYDSVGHGSYVQGPNGPVVPRDPLHYHYGRKEF